MQLRKKGALTVQDDDLLIPEMIHIKTKMDTFWWNFEMLLFCAENIDAVKKCGMEISES